MCPLIFLFIATANCARVYDLNTYLQTDLNNYGALDNVGVARRNINHRSDEQFVNPDLNRYGPRFDRFLKTNGPRYDDRHPGGHIPPGHRGFIDRSNIITDRIRSNIFSNVQSDRQFANGDIYRANHNHLRNRHSGNTDRGSNEEVQTVKNYSTTQSTNKFHKNNINKITQQDTVTATQTQNSVTSRAFDATVKNTTHTEKPRTTKYALSNGTGSIDDSNWVWGTVDDGNTSTASIPDDFNNREALSGDNCPTGKVRVLEKCVEKH